MQDFATVVYSTLGGAVAAVGTVKLLARWFVQHQLDKALKDHEARLGQKAEVLKTQLAIYAHEQNVAVARVDVQRSQALHATFSAIRQWEVPVISISHGSPLRDVPAGAHVALYRKLCEEAHAASKALDSAVSDNAIYVDRHLFAQLQDLSTECGYSISQVLAPIRQGMAQGWSHEDVLDAIEAHRKTFNEVYCGKIRPAIDAITLKFRFALGIEDQAS